MLKLAVIGVGSMGRNHARVYQTLKNVDLVAVCDTDRKVGLEISKAYQTRFYSNYEDLILNERPNAVSIAVPTKFHKDVALAFINNGISVLVEKPLAPTVEEANLIVKTAKQKKVTLSVGHIERFNPAVSHLKRLVDKGQFGKILSIVIKRVGLYPPRIKDANVVTDLAVHDLDIVTQLLQRLPYSVFARGSGELTNSREDHAEIFLDYGDFGCFIQVNWVTPIKIRTLSLTGTKGHIELNYITQEANIYKSRYTIRQTKDFKEFVVEFGEPKILKLNIPKQEPLKVELENFVTCLKNKSTPRVTGEDGLKAVALAEAVNKSIRYKKEVKLKR